MVGVLVRAVVRALRLLVRALVWAVGALVRALRVLVVGAARMLARVPHAFGWVVRAWRVRSLGRALVRALPSPRALAGALPSPGALIRPFPAAVAALAMIAVAIAVVTAAPRSSLAGADRSNARIPPPPHVASRSVRVNLSSPRHRADDPTRSIPRRYAALYKHVAKEYGLDWSKLAAVGQIESDHGRSPLPGVLSGTNSAGAVGPAQFLKTTWARFGVDADGRDKPNPYDPADAITAMAAYLKAEGAPQHWSQALYAYNHSWGYVRAVLALSRRLARQSLGLHR